MNEKYIHPSAFVDKTSDIGSGTKIWINVQIRENVKIGHSCILSKDVYIDHSVKIGDRCKIQNGVSVYNGVEIEDDVFVGPHVTFTNDKIPRAFNDKWSTSSTLISKGSSIGANSTIICGISIGKYALVGAGSVVTKDVPDYALVIGNPAKIVGYVCTCGYKLDKKNYCDKCKSHTKVNDEKDY
jgi:UDP-2-acetamido-3-amino-2,3-dideoxy-glucuronate N-acetyltransferase